MLSSTHDLCAEFRHLLFQLPNLFQEFRQLLQRDPLALGLFVRLRGDAEDDALVRDVAHDAGFRADHRLSAKLEVASDSGL